MAYDYAADIDARLKALADARAIGVQRVADMQAQINALNVQILRIEGAHQDLTRLKANAAKSEPSESPPADLNGAG